MNQRARLNRLLGEQGARIPKTPRSAARRYAGRPNMPTAARIGTRSRCLKSPRRGTCSAPATAAP